MNSLGINKPPSNTKVAVAMSGGVDSSVVAAMLAAEGYEVIGITLQLYDHLSACVPKDRSCCAGRDIRDAEAVANKMGFRHITINMKKAFLHSVIEDFADSYLRGETPIPCIKCNQIVKFNLMLDRARDLGCDVMATGHYVQRIMGDNGPEMHRAVDHVRDQSYFMFTTTKDQLDYLRFPLGGFQSKVETRSLAEKYGLVVAQKPDSQDICFVEGSYTDVVNSVRPNSSVPGNIVDLSGRILGKHTGIINYTIGQRKGLNFQRPSHEIYFVVRIDPTNNQIIVGTKNDLASNVVNIRDMNWLGSNDPNGQSVFVKNRSTQVPVSGTICGSSVILDEPHYGIAPGQACVFYNGNRMLGGGWITK